MVELWQTSFRKYNSCADQTFVQMLLCHTKYKCGQKKEWLAYKTVIFCQKTQSVALNTVHSQLSGHVGQYFSKILPG